jgi:hypothetical protein
MRGAAAEQNFERAAWLRRRRERLAWLLERLGGVLAATHCPPAARAGRAPARRALRRVLARGRARGRLGAAGRPRRGHGAHGAARCAAATAPAPPRAWRPDEVDEARIVSTWLDAHDAPVLDLHGGADRAAVARLLASVHDDGHAHAGRVQRADDPVGARRGSAAARTRRVSGWARRKRAGPERTVTLCEDWLRQRQVTTVPGRTVSVGLLAAAHEGVVEDADPRCGQGAGAHRVERLRRRGGRQRRLGRGRLGRGR